MTDWLANAAEVALMYWGAVAVLGWVTRTAKLFRPRKKCMKCGWDQSGRSHADAVCGECHRCSMCSCECKK